MSESLLPPFPKASADENNHYSQEISLIAICCIILY